MGPVTARRCLYCLAHNVWDRVRYLDAHGEVTTYPAARMFVESVVCLTCKRLIPLGPANDASEAVEIEIRAAEIALTRPIAIRDHELLGWRRAHAERGYHDNTEAAGWLAFEIFMHKEPSNAR